MIFSKSFLFSVLVVSSISAKVVHLSSHRNSLPILLFVLYLPTFFIPDILLVIGGRLLLSTRNNASFALTVASFITSIISIITLFSSASQIAFYLETGGEVRWSAASNFAHDPAGLKLLASGSVGIGLCTAGLTFVSTLLNAWLYQKVGDGLEFVGHLFSRQRSISKLEADLQPYQDEPSDAIAAPDVEAKSSKPTIKRPLLWRILLLSVVGVVALLQVLRPRSSPYGHLTTTLPFTLYEIFSSSEAAVCGANAASIPFPKPELLEALGWPSNNSNNTSNTTEIPAVPDWLPKYEIAGFDRFYEPHPNGTTWMPYNPKRDPLKISNLDESIFYTLQEAFEENEVMIKHVVLFHLESTRQDAFPLTNESHLHQLLTGEMGAFHNISELNSRLNTISKNAELLTGVHGGLGPGAEKSKGWRKHLQDGKGGLNVVGSQTAGTATLKSLIGSICGADPLPVDFTEEADLAIYQACLPHVFNLLSQGKDKLEGDSRSAVLARPWRSIHAQATTDQFDRQDVLMDNMGFNDSLARSFLMDPTSKYYPPKEPEANYFAYPEPELKPYLRDLFKQSEDEGTRLFLSHLTSTTHHPWSVPASYGDDEDFLSHWHWNEERPLNRYLNTLRYQDRWIGDFMDVLGELDVLDETLIVFAGDHGMAFREDCEALTTFENPHVINFQVPLLFFHPQLPRMQIKAATSSLSILPTILDLLIQSHSLDQHDITAASNLLQEYEGQSLLRPYLTEQEGRESWHFTVINAGAALLSVASAAVPWRLVMPLCKTAPYRFTNLDTDPAELHPVELWTIADLAKAVQKSEGEQAASWVKDAERMGLWWAGEQKRKWGYTGASLQDDKAPSRADGVGKINHDHWWNT